MKSRVSSSLPAGALAILLVAVASVYAQTTLIGPFTRNGSFEDGGLSPWVGSFNNFGVEADGAFASHGDWFAVAQSGVTLSPGISQNLHPDAAAGLLFLLSFDARTGTPGYTSVGCRMSARTSGGEPVSAVVTPLVVPPLSSVGWRTYQYQLQMPSAWDASGIGFAIAFSTQEPLGGTLHSSFLDNVVLQQIPEPSAGVLFALGLGGLLTLRRSKQNPQRARNAVTEPEHGAGSGAA
jgi:hypothetical protein